MRGTLTITEDQRNIYKVEVDIPQEIVDKDLVFDISMEIERKAKNMREVSTMLNKEGIKVIHSVLWINECEFEIEGGV